MHRLANRRRSGLGYHHLANKRLHAASAWARLDHGGGQQVDPPDKLGHRPGSRAFVDVLGRANLRHLAVEHHHDPVRHGQRLGLVMRHVDGGDANAALKLPDEVTHLVTQSGVEVCQRLIEQQYPGFDDQRPGQRDALLLPA
jgi:hypothetical protein